MNTDIENKYINGAYERTNPEWFREDSVWKSALINKLIEKHHLTPHTITEIGCGVGEILLNLAELRKEVAHFEGYDIAPFAIETARKKESDRVRFFLGDFRQTMEQPTNLLLAIDVVEHIADYYGFLKSLQSKSTHFIFHIPLDLSCRTLLKPHVLRQQRQDVGHLHYFSKEHVLWALEDSGFTIVDFEYTFSETDRNQVHTLKGYFKKYARRFSFSLAKELSVKLWGGYSLMLFCTRNE